MAINRYFHSDMRGAPVLAGNAPGALIALLDACLITGFGAVTATSVAVSGGVATATLPSAMAFEVGAVIGVSGATPAALNGDARVTASSQTSVSWATTAPDGAASGSISIRYAPMGWLKPHSGTNLAVYKPSVIQATGCCLRVDASSGIAARVRGYESMSDVNTGTGPFPTDTQQSGGGYWPCSRENSGTGVAWEVYASDTGFHFACAYWMSYNGGYVGRTGWWFGDLRTRRAGDMFHASLLAGSSNSDVNGSNTRSMNSQVSAVYIARSYTQLGGSRRAGRFSHCLSTPPGSPDHTYSGASAFGGVYPNAADNALLLSPLLVIEGEMYDPQCLRGHLPGVYHSSQLIPAGVFQPRSIVNGSAEFAGRKLHAMPGYAGESLSTAKGATFFDLSDDWL